MAILTLILYTMLLVGLIYLFLIALKPLRMCYVIKNIPGPKALPIIGSALMFIGDTKKMTDKLLQLYDIYPSLFRFWLGNKLFICTKDAEIIMSSIGEISQVILSSSSAIHKKELYKFMKHMLGDGLLTAPVSTWQIHRRQLSQAFNRNILKSYMDTFVRNTNIFVRKLELTNGEEIEVKQPIESCALDIIFETVLEFQLNQENDKDGKLLKAIEETFKVTTLRMLKLWLHPEFIYSRTQLMKKKQKFFDYINDVTKKVYTQKRMKQEIGNVQDLTQENEEEQKSKFFMDILMQLSQKGGKLSDKILQEEINTFIYAGNLTVTDALSFIFLMLATFPEIQDKAYQELREIYGTSNVEDMPVECNDFQRMNYIDRVIKETMRIFPTIPVILREIVEDIKVGNDRVIPKGSTAMLCIFKLHRNSKYWPDPLKFDPDRFLPENVAAQHPYSYLPFSRGPRDCIGRTFASMEIKTIVATVLRKFIIAIDKPVSIEEINVDISIALTPINPIKLRFKKRF